MSAPWQRCGQSPVAVTGFHKVQLVICLLKGTAEVFYEASTKMLFSISISKINSSIVHVNSSHGALDNVSCDLFPICLHPLFNFVLKRVVNVGWFYEGDDLHCAFWGLQHNQWDQISLHSTGSGNDYLELTQIKDLFLLSWQDQSKKAAPLWLASEAVEITALKTSSTDNLFLANKSAQI